MKKRRILTAFGLAVALIRSRRLRLENEPTDRHIEEECKDSGKGLKRHGSSCLLKPTLNFSKLIQVTAFPINSLFDLTMNSLPIAKAKEIIGEITDPMYDCFKRHVAMRILQKLNQYNNKFDSIIDVLSEWLANDVHNGLTFEIGLSKFAKASECILEGVHSSIVSSCRSCVLPGDICVYERLGSLCGIFSVTIRRQLIHYNDSHGATAGPVASPKRERLLEMVAEGVTATADMPLVYFVYSGLIDCCGDL